MDNKETNKLQAEAGLEETLKDTATPAVEQSDFESSASGDESIDIVATSENSDVTPVSENIASTETDAEKPKTKKSKKSDDSVHENIESEATVESEKSSDLNHESNQNSPSKQEVIDQLKVVIESIDEDVKEKIDFLKQTFYRILKSENEIEKTSQDSSEENDENAKSDPLEVILKDLLNNWREKKANKLAEQEKERKNNLERKLQIIEEIKNLTDSSEDIGKTLPEFRRLQQSWKETGNIPQEQVTEIWKKYQIQIERFYDLLKINNEFREYDFKKNLEIKTNLCESAEKIAEESDVVLAFRQLQKLHDDWRETGPVAKEYREDIWNRFKNASSIINKKHQLFFEKLKSAENENLAQKTTICETVESIDFDSLKSYKDWDNKTAEIIHLQDLWKKIGFAPKKVNNKVFDRFRAGCDNFFQKKSDFYKSSKEILNQNLEKKKLLCEKAESLKESTDWKSTSETMVQIQKEWKSIGPVPKKLSDSIWNRFISACDYFFEQKEKFAPSQKNEEIKNLNSKKELIDQINNIAESMPEDEAVNLYHELVARWNAIGFVPFKEKDKVYKAWHEAVDRLSEKLNINKENRRLNKFQHNLDDMTQKGQGKVLHERERLLRQFDSISNEIKTAENNIGFFTMSKNSNNSFLIEMNKKIESLKEERDLIYKKIKLIDEQL
jgi:hypothetical protein